MNKYRVRVIVEFEIEAFEAADAVELVHETLEDYDFNDMCITSHELITVEEALD